MRQFKAVKIWIKAKRWRRFVAEFTWAAIFAFALPLQDYFRQVVTLAYPSELWLLLTVFVIVALVIFTIFYFTLRAPFARLLATMFAVYLVMQNSDLRGLVSRFSDLFSNNTIIIFPLSVLLLSSLIAFVPAWLLKRYLADAIPKAATVLRFICLVALVYNLAAASLYLVKHFKTTTYKATSPLAGLKLPSQPDRDIYYLVFDRYASSQSLKDYENFDNSQFMTFLKGQGFTVRDQAFSNYQYTAPSIASTMRSDYLTDVSQTLRSETEASYLPYRQIIENSPVAQVLRSNGYDSVNMGSWWEVTRQQNQAKNILPQYQLTILGHTRALSELQSDVLGRTFLGPLLNHGFKIGSFQLAQIVSDSWDNLFKGQVAELEQLASTAHDRPQFVFAHFLNPHPPYLFTADGSSPDYDGSDSNAGIQRSLKYTNQLQYDNTQIEQIIQTIKGTAKKPPLILIQADEGPYPIGYDSSDNQAGKFNWQDVSNDTAKEKFGILGAYYLPDIAEAEKTQLNSSVNLFRFVFDHYFGAQLPYLPDCSLVFNLGDKPFQFYDITQKLHSTDTDCNRYTGR